MKKMMMAAAAIGMTGILASCGSGEAPDGSAKGSIDSVRTEYRLNSTSGAFIACDNVTGNTAGRARSTQVAVNFTLQGNIQDITIGLKGQTSDRYDNNYKTTATGEQLANIGNGKYRVTFDANSSNGAFLPQSIIVNPVAVTVKVVSATGNVGGFYPQLVVNTGTSNFTINNILRTVQVYSNCNVTQTTQEEI
ncbi:hypothetical protein ACFP9V_17105 [Deinococcus radiopugnans]|uniref:DUF4382 domain-containing protein n=1 Tax=Deinococcus radiopugnans ATCC 19172 TaxID=585398 RepID=A0ABR6NS88_9DEIO|nr:hypothetical protein [Deinococcus radiopugnans]MBB6016733.1 hypothetical protein [Deinococcus radiopugnans ATCC 19172]